MTASNHLPRHPEVIRAHAHGWAVCKADTIQPMPLGWRLGLSRGVERRRLIVTRGTFEAIVSLLRSAPPGTTMRMCADTSWWTSRLPLGWVVDHDGWYFTADVATQAKAHPEIETSSSGRLITATLRQAGQVVASGQAAAWDGWLTLDSIEVSPSHRWLGHGRRIVQTLCHAGLGDNCTHAVLSSTSMGRHLYTAMGWTEIGPQVCASRQE